MTWMSTIAHLTFSLLFWSAAFPCQAAEPPSDSSSMSCNPCCAAKCGGKGKCDSGATKTDGAVACPLCPAPSCLPSAPVTWPTEGMDSNWGYPPSGPCVLPPCAEDQACPSVCPAAFQSPPKAGTQPMAYEVQVRFNGEGCCSSENCCTSPKVTLVEGGHALVSMCVPDDKGSCHTQVMHVHLGKAEGDCINLQLTVAPAAASRSPCPCMKSPVKLHGEQTVHFDTVTGVVLSGNTPEPRCAQVVVTTAKRHVAPPTPANHCELLPPPTPCAPPPPPAPRPTAKHWNVMTEPTPVACSTMAVPPPAPPYYPPYYQQPVMTYLPAPIPEPAPMYRQPMPAVTLTRMPPPGYPPVMGFIEPPRPDPRGHGSLIRVVHESGKAKLKMKTTDGVSSTSVRMKVETGEAGCLHFAAGKKHVHVSGKQWNAVADHVELYEDGAVILTGHVKIVSGKVGVCSSIKADHAALEVHHGKIENIDGGMFSKR